MRIFAALLLFPVVLFGATESVSIDTKTKKVQNPIVNFGTGNTLNGTGATIIGFPGSSYTFIDSLTQSAGNVSLVNDSASPGNSKYYGTDSGGVLGFHTVTGGGGTFIGLDFTGNNLTFMNGTTMWKSTGDSNDTGVHPYTPTTAGIIVKDANNEEVFRIWGSDPNEDNLNSDNLFIGRKAGLALTTGYFNTGIGALALSALTAEPGDLNTAVGVYSLPSLTTGQENTALGASAGTSAITSNSMVFIGSSSDQSSAATLNNGIAIGADSRVETSLTAVIGSTSQTDVYFGSTSGNSNMHGSTLFLNPTPTPSPVEGRFTAGTNHHSYYYNGTIWKQLDNDTPTPTPTATPSATATPTPTPSATATAFPQGFTAHFSRGGAAIQVNDVTITPWTTKYPGTITGFIISADQGTCTLKVWKKADSTTIPTIANVINTNGVSLSSGTHTPLASQSDVSDFTTTTVSVGDQFMAQVTAVSGGATDITFQVPIRQ